MFVLNHISGLTRSAPGLITFGFAYLHSIPSLTAPCQMPEPGQLFHLQQRRWLIESVEEAPGLGQATLVHAACADDDAQGEQVAVLWEHELCRTPRLLSSPMAALARQSLARHRKTRLPLCC